MTHVILDGKPSLLQDTVFERAIPVLVLFGIAGLMIDSISSPVVYLASKPQSLGNKQRRKRSEDEEPKAQPHWDPGIESKEPTRDWVDDNVDQKHYCSQLIEHRGSLGDGDDVGDNGPDHGCGHGPASSNEVE